MAIKLFGFNISRDDEKEKENVKSFTPPHNDDGTVAVNEGGAYGTTVDVGYNSKTEIQLITKYREMAQQPECERAIDDIINESIINEEYGSPVNIVLDEITELSPKMKETLRDEFSEILSMLNFNICMLNK